MDSNYNEASDDEEALPVVPEYSLDEDDLYACLNVPKTATTDEITAAYRRFSRIYHPDKNPSNKAAAESLFLRLKKAHEILSNPATRAVYDTIGLEGLESQGNELVERYQTPQEIREAYERLQREKQDREMERQTHPKGSVTVNINASEIFNPYISDEEDPYYADAVVPYVEFTGFHFHQSIEAPLTPRDTLIMGGSVNDSNGRGSGNISLALRRTLSNKTWAELEFGGSTSGLDFGLKGFSQFGKRFFTNLSLLCRNTGDGIGMAGVFGVGNQLDAHSVGTLTWRAGGGGHSLVGGLVRDNGTNRLSLSLHLGIPHVYGMVQTSHKRDDTKYRFNAKAGTFGAFCEVGIEKKVSQFTTVGALMIVGVPNGVILRVKVVRANQSYIFPIQLAEEIIPSAIVYGTIAPILLYLTVKKLILEPYEQQKAAVEKEKKQTAYRNKMAEKRAEAEASIHLMRNTYERIRTEEESKDGLLIQNAVYGRLVVRTEENDQNEEEIINVTVPLQCLVKDSTLVVHKGSKVHIPGFYDPAPGETKSLLIQYRFKNLMHEIMIQDEQEIKIPKRAHQISNSNTTDS